VAYYLPNWIEGNSEFGLHALMADEIAPIAIC
jgi:hypothetical protein